MQQKNLKQALATTTLAALLCLLPVANLHASQTDEKVKSESQSSTKEIEANLEGHKQNSSDNPSMTETDVTEQKESVEPSKESNSETVETTVKATKIPESTEEPTKTDKHSEAVWKTPVVVYGAALSIDEITAIRELFGLGNVTELSETTVDSSDLNQFLGSTASDSDMISSVAVQKREKGYGVRIKIVTPDRITQITEAMYTNAAISAGVHDCQIMVAAPRSVTGESALAGVYKAFKIKGENFNSKQIQVSQDELKTVNAINQSHITNKNYSSTRLDRAVLDTKLAIQSQAAKLGNKLSANQITTLLNKNLAKYGLDNIIQPKQIEQLSKVFEGFQNTDALNSEVVREQLQLLGQKLQAVFDQFHADAVKAGFWDRIVQFVRDIWQTIMTTVNNLAGEVSKKSV